MHSPTSKAAALLLALGLTSRTDAVCIFGLGDDCPEETSAPTFNPTTNLPTSSSPTTSIPTWASSTTASSATTPIFNPTTGITIQAEYYSNMDGVEFFTDEGSGEYVGSIEKDDWMSYPEVMIPSPGVYTVEYQVASESLGGSFQFERAGGTPVYGSVSFPATGGWQTWVTISHNVTLEVGPNYFGIKATGGVWNMNWFRITPSSNLTIAKEETTAPTFYPTTNIPTLSPTSKIPNSTSAPASITTAPISTTTIPTTSVQDPQNTQDSADCTRAMCEYQLSDNFLLKYQVNVPSDTTLEMCDECIISMEAVYEGEAWVSIAFSTDGMMIGSEAVIGIPGAGVPQKYHMLSKNDNGVVLMPESEQTLKDASVEVVDGQTVMKFTKIMKETGGVQITSGENKFLWAYGSSNTLGHHSARSPFDLNLSSGLASEVVVPNYSVWLGHGVMAFLAWAVLVPISANASLFRGLLPKGSLWFNLHRSFNTAAFALSIALFSIAVSYTTKERRGHFSSSHGRIGLVMFILMTIQMLRGIFRPRLTYPGSVKAKTKWRKGWEIGHRLLGTVLLSCGFWQMSSGIKSFSNNYSVSASNEQNLLIAYWVWVGVITTTTVVGMWYSKIRKAKSNDPSFVSSSVDDIDTGIIVPNGRTSFDA